MPLTQTELAARLGVTHAAFNRWLNNRATPRPRHIEEIRKLHESSGFYAGLESACDIAGIRKRLSKLKKIAPPLPLLLNRPDLHDEFLLRLTYHTNSIEGSTLSQRETQAVLFDDRVIAKHPLREHLEVTNHRLAFAKMLEVAMQGADPDLRFVLELHRLLMNGIISDAGNLRAHPVRIVGSRTVPPNPVKVADKMRDLCVVMTATRDPIGIIMQHSLFEGIHPFSDGNGRIGRLILNFQLLRADWPCLIIRAERKTEYYATLETAQVKNIYAPLLNFCLDEMEESAKLFR